MNLAKIINRLQLKVLTREMDFSKIDIQSGYASDLLSCVMTGAESHAVWVTLISNINIVAVASLLEIPAIIITENAKTDQATIDQADIQGIVLLSSPKANFEMIGQLWEMGIGDKAIRNRKIELHIHSVLSADTVLEMIPPFIIEKALQENIEILALTDHNTGANVPALIEAARGSGITIIPGMELETEENVHVLCLFDHLHQLQAFEKIVNAWLPDKKNNESFFGTQLVVDAEGNFIRKDDRLLQTATGLSLFQAQKYVHGLGGLFIPAHVEREQSGLLPRLGSLPPELKPSIIEVSHYADLGNVQKRWPEIKGIPTITNGDAHDLDAILGLTTIRIGEVNLKSIEKSIVEQF